MTMGNVYELLGAALDCNQDTCPGNRKYMLCMKNEEYIDSLCRACWSQYLYAVANGDAHDELRYHGDYSQKSVVLVAPRA